jgi:hypothetical protein
MDILARAVCIFRSRKKSLINFTSAWTGFVEAVGAVCGMGNSARIIIGILRTFTSNLPNRNAENPNANLAERRNVAGRAHGI